MIFTPKFIKKIFLDIALNNDFHYENLFKMLL